MAASTLIQDWFNDRDSRFIKVRKDGRDCWEDKISSSSALSEVFLDSSISQEELLSKAYAIASDTITAMDTPKKVRLLLSPDSSSTDGSRVFVATDYFDDERLTPQQKADIFVGLTVHEGSHLLYTDFSFYGRNRFEQSICNILEDERIERLLGQERPGMAAFIGRQKEYYFDSFFSKRPDKTKLDPVSRFLNLLLTIIRYPKDLDMDEVECFEKYLLQVKDVLTPYPSSTEECLEAAKKIREIVADLFKQEKKKAVERKEREKEAEKEQEEESSDTPSEEENDSSKEGQNEPSKRDQNESPESSEPSDEPLENESSESPKEQEERTICEEKDEEEQTDEDEEYDDSEESADEEQPSADDADDTSDTGDGSNSEDSTEEDEDFDDETEDGKDSSAEGEEEDEKGESEESESSLDSEESEASGDSEEENQSLDTSSMLDGIGLSDMLDDLTEMLDELNPGGEDEVCSAIQENPLTALCIDGRLRKGMTPNTYLLAPYADRDRYMRTYEQIRQYIPAVSRSIDGLSQEMSLTFTGLRSGRLDTHRLALAVQGVPNIYSRKMNQKVNRIAVCLLLDMSGSMFRSDLPDGLTRMDRARQTAVLMSEALSSNPNIELFIYGHTGDDTIDNATEIYPFREGRLANKYLLGGLDAKSQNFDGYAIREVATQIRRKTDLPCLMFVISDGEPAYCIEKDNGSIGGSGHYSRMISGEEHTRKCVSEVTKMGFTPIQICMTSEQDSEEMFDHWIKFDDLSEFPQRLNNLIKRSVMKILKRAVV